MAFCLYERLVLMERQISRYSDPLEHFLKMNIDRDFSIFSEIMDPYFIINTSGKILYANQACHKQLGYSVEELIRLELKDICSESDLNHSKTYFIKDNREKFTSFYIQMLGKNDDILDLEVFCVPILLKSKVIGAYVVLRDAQTLLLKREKFYGKLIEHSPDAVFILKENTIVDVSNEALSMIGISKKEELLGESFFLLLDSSNIELFYEKLHFVEKEHVTDKFEQKMIRTDGTLLEVDVKILPTVHNGEYAFHVIIKDISESKKLTQLSEKQAVAGQLAAGIAHEIRNPITAIKGFLKLMASDEGLQMPYYHIIESEIIRIEVILNELMGLARPTKLKLEKLNIREEVIDKVLILMEPQALLNGIKVTKNVKHQDARILGDENQLKQVLINYIKNAIEAMPNGGEIQVDLTQNVGQVCVTITDEGGGIPPDIQARMGEPFFTTKENGTGLGMIVSHQIIKEHKGDIRLSSNNEGTCIEVILPTIE